MADEKDDIDEFLYGTTGDEAKKDSESKFI